MGKTLEDLFYEYEIEKNAIMRENTARELEIYAQHPALERLEMKRRALVIDELKNVFRSPENKETIKEIFFLRLKEIEDAAADYRTQHDIRAISSPVLCPLCGGSGYSANGNLCLCLKEKAYAEVFGGEEISGLEGSFAGFSAEVFPEAGGQRERMVAMRQFFQEYAAEYPDNAKKQLVLVGTTGLGKSFLLASVLKELQVKQRDICYIRASRLFDYFHRHRLGEVSEIDLLYNAAVMAIDDVGSEPMTQNVTREYFFDLLCHREKAGLHTFVVTNNTFSQLKERYTEKTTSRLFGGKNSIVMRFTGEDLRLLMG